MSTHHRHASSYLARLLTGRHPDDLAARLAPRTESPAPRVPGGSQPSAEAIERRWQLLPQEARPLLLDGATAAQAEVYRRNIENFIGTVKVPVGVAGPLRVNGLFAQGDYYVPLATTEAALVASYNRGSQLISEAGGCTAVLLNEGVSRAPGFAFRDLAECGRFVVWATEQFDEFRRIAETTTRHGKLIDLRLTIEGNHVYLCFEFTTGEASGQNMVTIATAAVCDYIQAHSPVRPQYSFIEANLSGDKKASAQSFVLVRGKKVTAEVRVPAALVQKRLHTTPEQMVNYWRMSALGSVLSGTLGAQGHYANGLAALYLATGQDVACVAESAVGVTRFEVVEDGALYAAVTLPNVMVGTVGGGTGLPSQRACLQVLGLDGACPLTPTPLPGGERGISGPLTPTPLPGGERGADFSPLPSGERGRGEGGGRAQALAEVCAGLCLAGELSIIGALCAGDFARAHQLLARGRSGENTTNG